MQVYRHSIEGPRLLLRGLSPDDVTERYLAWMNDPEVGKYLESRFSVYSMDDLREYVIQKTSEESVVFLAIVIKDSSKHIGNIKLGPIHPFHKYGDIGIIIGDKSEWGKGYATEAIQLLSAYAFSRLGVEKLTAGCYSVNQGSARAFLAAGFEAEGIRKGMCVCDGERTDALLFGKLKPVAE